MNFLIYSREIRPLDSLFSTPSRLLDSPASGEFIAQRNIRFRPIGNLIATGVTEGTPLTPSLSRQNRVERVMQTR
jgi:hypothetical protein